VTREHTRPYAYGNEYVMAKPNEIRITLEAVASPTPPDLHCAETQRWGKFSKAGQRCCARPRLVINGKPLCDAHVARFLRRLLEPVDVGAGGGI
jgi:hypothetical protein